MVFFRTTNMFQKKKKKNEYINVVLKNSEKNASSTELAMYMFNKINIFFIITKVDHL